MAAPKAAALPAQYAKFLTALGADLVAYLGIYGATWHLQPALVFLGGALAVLGVPNAPARPTAADVGRQVAGAIKAAEQRTGTVTVVPAQPPEATP